MWPNGLAKVASGIIIGLALSGILAGISIYDRLGVVEVRLSNVERAVSSITRTVIVPPSDKTAALPATVDSVVALSHPRIVP